MSEIEDNANNYEDEESKCISMYEEAVEEIINPLYFIDTKTEIALNRLMPPCYREIYTPKIPFKLFHE